jgi:hypothetical protein
VYADGSAIIANGVSKDGVSFPASGIAYLFIIGTNGSGNYFSASIAYGGSICFVFDSSTFWFINNPIDLDLGFPIRCIKE